MSRLTNLGAGDLTDRLTILALKLLHYGAAGKPTEHLRNEQTALLAKLRTRELNGSWFDLVLELGAVNAAIWTATDDLRPYTIQGWEPDEAARVADLGTSIMRLNDRRAQLVDEINKLTGEFLGSEKG